MTIECGTIQQLVEICASLVERGFGFNADADRLIITLTGAF
jgi:hypothetical protein